MSHADAVNETLRRAEREGTLPDELDTGPLDQTIGDSQDGQDNSAWRDEQILRELYHEERMTTREIGDSLGCTSATVSYWLDKHGIETRENWVAGVEAAKRANRVERVALRQLPSGCEYWQSKEWRAGDDSRTNEIVYVHRLLAVAEFGFESVCGRDVHHRNGVPWDNRLENIELLSKSEHARIGNTRRIKDEELLDEIVRLAVQLGKIPTTRDLREYGQYSWPTYNDRFGGWLAAVKLAVEKNLDTLVETGLVEKSERDRRTNEYALTDDAWATLERHVVRTANAVGLVVTTGGAD